MTIPDVSTAPTGPLSLTMPIHQCTPPIIERLKEILRTHPGNREVHLHLDDLGRTTVMKLGSRVTASPSLSADLKSILGPDCLT